MEVPRAFQDCIQRFTRRDVVNVALPFDVSEPEKAFEKMGRGRGSCFRRGETERR